MTEEGIEWAAPAWGRCRFHRACVCVCVHFVCWEWRERAWQARMCRMGRYNLSPLFSLPYFTMLAGRHGASFAVVPMKGGLRGVFVFSFSLSRLFGLVWFVQGRAGCIGGLSRSGARWGSSPPRGRANNAGGYQQVKERKKGQA